MFLTSWVFIVQKDEGKNYNFITSILILQKNSVLQAYELSYWSMKPASLIKVSYIDENWDKRQFPQWKKKNSLVKMQVYKEGENLNCFDVSGKVKTFRS